MATRHLDSEKIMNNWTGTFWHIRKLTLDKAPRDKVFTYIGHSAGVYIGCSEKGIHIQAAL